MKRHTVCGILGHIGTNLYLVDYPHPPLMTDPNLIFYSSSFLLV